MEKRGIFFCKSEKRGNGKCSLIELRMKVSKLKKKNKQGFPFFIFLYFFFVERTMESSSNNNLYQTLGLQKTATPEEIKKVKKIKENKRLDLHDTRLIEN